MSSTAQTVPPSQQAAAVSPTEHDGGRYVQWVVKTSKLCNLRCRYCYEFPSLADPTKMDLAHVRRLLARVARFYDQTPGTTVEFVWHGGEPLLLGSEYFDSIFEAQKRIFAKTKTKYSNTIQTNLTILSPKILQLLSNFDAVGVSFDPAGYQRVDCAGKNMDHRVVQNMQRLQDAGLKFGCITVLEKHNVKYVDETYDFFADIGCTFRVLPYYRVGVLSQVSDHALSADDVLQAFKRLACRWLDSSADIRVHPIQGYFEIALRTLRATDASYRLYTKQARELVYIVNTDGMLYSIADAYDPALAHGNIFRQSLQDIVDSKAYQGVVAAANLRMRAACSSCKYLGDCSGFFMAEATEQQRRKDSEGRLSCAVVRPLLGYLRGLLTRLGIGDEREAACYPDMRGERARAALARIADGGSPAAPYPATALDHSH